MSKNSGSLTVYITTRTPYAQSVVLISYSISGVKNLSGLSDSELLLNNSSVEFK